MTRKELLLYTLQNQFLLEKAVRRRSFPACAAFRRNLRTIRANRCASVPVTFPKRHGTTACLRFGRTGIPSMSPEKEELGLSSPPKAETGLGETGRPASRRRQNGTGHRLSGTRWPAASICGSL